MKILSLLLLGLLAVTARAETLISEVTAVDDDALTFTLADGKEVKVSRGDARIGYVGRRIQGQFEAGDPLPTLTRIWPATPADLARLISIDGELRADTKARGRKAFRRIGEQMPPFALWDQDGQLVTDASFKGHPLVLSFIFTRCKMANMCPATTAKMVSLQRQATEAGLDNARFALITFDPEYDTPGVLNEYGTQRGADFATFSLLTGPKIATDDLMKQFGILTIEEDGTINHTAATILVGPDGSILYRSEGPGWTAQEFLDKLKAE
ncbi:SCO family protein [Ruficoccus amylovorans]|uniref:SCO family protein n=1 Tax=Ruficoccus amylovorans TaxID=1804625 RepID=A0A842HCB4_9BACT|nr:SCO family protein [Ruficoccus amylovorans]MBC2594103.1 SCO family protein [Ruficoccus amylovorans]